jgi:HEPN domain-containing protein
MADTETYDDYILSAKRDVSGIEAFLRDYEPHNELIVYLTQQVAEKMLKAALVQSGIKVQKTHRVEALLVKLHDAGLVNASGDIFEKAAILTTGESAARYKGYVGISQAEAIRAMSYCNEIAALLKDSNFNSCFIGYSIGNNGEPMYKES